MRVLTSFGDCVFEQGPRETRQVGIVGIGKGDVEIRAFLQGCEPLSERHWVVRLEHFHHTPRLAIELVYGQAEVGSPMTPTGVVTPVEIHPPPA
jgi:hypothetical protein